ncbi:MAG TPA: hypothetical protein VN327_02975 [Pseudonocardiaceae bacterium]|jgi:hypothetical protein|nr:hypothetical protein [Pseudonocardiaceae bacterium]
MFATWMLSPAGPGDGQIVAGVEVFTVLKAAQLRVGKAAAQDDIQQGGRVEQLVAEAGVGHAPESELGA